MCTLYDRIQELCKIKGISGSRMCLDLGISKSTLSDIKSGRKKGISTETAKKIASYFGVSVGYLLCAEQKESPAPEQGWTDEEFERAIRDLPKDQLIKLIARMSSILAEEQGEDKKIINPSGIG